MTITLTETDFGGPDDAELLILGPSLGTSVTALWAQAADRLAERFRVIGWDLPGHGRSRASGPFVVAELAAAVLAVVDRVAPGSTFRYAGVSVGGAVGLQLALDVPQRISVATLLCTGAVIGTPEDWRARAVVVRRNGVEAVRESSQRRWFAPGFVRHRPYVAMALADALAATDAQSYAHLCDALADFDVTDRLGEITIPVCAVAGADDIATPPAKAERIAAGVVTGRVVVLDGVGHLAPAEAPAKVAEIIGGSTDSVYEAGMSVRREVLGDEHVDRANAGRTEFTADFQDLITRYAWGEIWTRPGLDRRSRSMITLTAMVARGHHEELAMHVRAARRNGLSSDEIKEVLLQTAIYCGVPDANTAFRIAGAVLADEDDPR
ncbi:4-carboxymuconolactone decarboxylase [Mycolicibacterium sp. P9-64]|uniref:bifunctional 3-oxoadipate enol-lactonase/4-carboxymuconolactone decarboxylase PcaDC n=1 Tax=Mycolicibacterium sp. P9-64 TaxID=2024612 RepID=UPI0011ED2D20|nr:4-carboxymuconolactone decarboxylase [Mycolicibacterium sp. P9-64]KAA0085201.1 4-carboxymuconolactone decarboxylase [Mycolicibacterium sp. P9-64]